MRKSRRNKAVANVVGTILMIGIIVPAIAVFAVSFTNIVTTQRAMIDAQIAVMQRFKEYMDDIYFYFSPESGNHAPNITGVYPSNRAVNVTPAPKPTSLVECCVNVSDEDGNNLLVSFSYYCYNATSFQWSEKTAEDVFCESNTTTRCKYPEACQEDTIYYWRVVVSDGITLTTSEIYSFKTSVY